MVSHAHMHSFHWHTHRQNQLGSCKISVKDVQWLMWKYRNKRNQSELIGNGSSIQQNLSKHKKYVRRLTRMQLTSWLQQPHPMLCIQSASLQASVQCANVYPEQKMMNNDFHEKIVEQWFTDIHFENIYMLLWTQLVQRHTERKSPVFTA